MSATIGINDLKFVIFGAGHDYTLADSGDGDVQVFSHPFVPKNSKNYAGQWFFLVPDENGDPLDAVKDDVAHCTFTPAIGSTFSTVGDVTVECHYHREYVHDEETIVVDKTVSQIITVVNHGSVSSHTNNLDVYSDGYGFIRPLTTSGVEVKDYSLTSNNSVKKLSSIPWRATGLGADELTGFFSSNSLTDVSELAFADVSNCTKFYGVFGGCSSLSDISAVAGWDVSNVDVIYHFGYYSDISSLEALTNWKTPRLTNLHAFLQHAESLTSLHGLENIDVSNVDDMSYMCDMCVSLSDISAVATWDMDKVETLSCAFIGTLITNVNALSSQTMPSLEDISSILENCDNLVDLSGLSNWISKLKTISGAFSGCGSLVDISGLSGLDVSEVEDFSECFSYDTQIISLHGLETWDFSSGKNFYRMYKGCVWISDISALSNKDMTNAIRVDEMFNGCAWITTVDDLANWRLNNPAITNMLTDGFGCYSAKLGKYLWYTAYYFYDYEGNQYTNSVVQDEDTPLTYPTYDAAKASLWGVTGSNLGAFDSKWINKPSWN